MVTEKQAKEGQIWSATKATESANIRWHQVVDELEKKMEEVLRNIVAIIYRNGHWANHNDKIDEILLYIDTLSKEIGNE